MTKREKEIRKAIDRYKEELKAASVIPSPPDITTGDVMHLLKIIDELRRRTQ